MSDDQTMAWRWFAAGRYAVECAAWERSLTEAALRIMRDDGISVRIVSWT